jgi:hypothetical protein
MASFLVAIVKQNKKLAEQFDKLSCQFPPKTDESKNYKL